MLKIAFAGFRHTHIIGLYRLAKESNRVEIVGAWEDDASTKESVSKEFEVIFNYDSYNDMLINSDADIIAIGDYYGIRGKLVIEALSHGKHVISDKPLCISLDELEMIKKLSNEKKLCVGLMLDLRYSSFAQCAKTVIESGALGEINNIIFGGQHPLLYGTRPTWYFEQGKHGGVINDIAIHGVDLIMYLTGLTFEKTLAARCWNAFAEKEKEFKDSAQFMCALNNGAGVIADVSYSAPDSIGFSCPFYWAFQLYGTKGMMAFGFNKSTVDLYINGKNEVEKISPEDSKLNCLDDFLNHINGEQCILTTKDVIEATEITLKIQNVAE